MSDHSAGILLYRHGQRGLEVLLVHPGGPYWRRRDAGAWQIPKGGIDKGETLLAAAMREFEEELGAPPVGNPQPLGRIRQAGGKWVDAFALQGDFNPDEITSITFEMEWPPRSGALRRFPEVDRAAWFTLSEAREKMLVSQRPLLTELEGLLARRGDETG